MKNIILILIIFIFSYCNSPVIQETNEINTANKQAEQSNSTVYLFRNDTILEKVEVINLTNNRIRFNITCINLRNQVSSNLEGIAALVENKNENAELGEDENGFAYVVDEYKYTMGKCWIYILIDNENKDKLTVEESLECRNIRSNLAPFNSIGILRKQ